MHDKSKKGERYQRLEQKLIKQKTYDRESSKTEHWLF